jgi:hypothetical protein
LDRRRARQQAQSCPSASTRSRRVSRRCDEPPH